MFITGAFTALITPFRDGQVDYERLKQNVAFQISEGIDGLVPCGTTGESPTLSHEEHDKVIQTVVEASAGRVPVIAGTGSNSTEEALRLTQHAREAGASLSLQVCPYYNKPTQEGLYRHFMTIADHVDIGLVLYNIPGRTGISLTAETVERLAEHPHIVGIKEATGSLDMASDIASRTDPDRFSILSGDDSLTLPIMAVGGRGVISVATNVIPRRVTAMVHSALDGDYELARTQHLELFDLFNAFFIEGNPATVKQAMYMLELDTGEVRSPLAPVSEATISKLRQVLESHELFEQVSA